MHEPHLARNPDPKHWLRVNKLVKITHVIHRLFARRFNCWAIRDSELIRQWNNAYQAGDHEAMDRLRYAIRKNYEGYCG